MYLGITYSYSILILIRNKVFSQTVCTKRFKFQITQRDRWSHALWIRNMSWTDTAIIKTLLQHSNASPSNVKIKQQLPLIFARWCRPDPRGFIKNLSICRRSIILGEWRGDQPQSSSQIINPVYIYVNASVWCPILCSCASDTSVPINSFVASLSDVWQMSCKRQVGGQ